MSMKLNPPDFSSKSYEQYRLELSAWEKITNLDKKKQAIAIALSLPENDKTAIRQRVFEELSLDELGGDDGLAKLMTFLDVKLGKDDLADSLEKFEDFDDFTRKDDQLVSDFITQFDQKYNRIVKKGMKLPPEILAFQLLKRAKITGEEKMLVLTGMDYGKKEELFEQAKKSLKKFKGAEPCGGGGAVAGAAVTVKREPTLINEDAYIAGYRMVPFDRNIGRGRFWNPQYRGKGSAASGSTQRKVNPPGKDGRPLTCRACGSFRHMLTDCPDSWENQKKKSAHQGNVLENEVLNTAVLFTGDEKDDVIRLGVESRFCAG